MDFAQFKVGELAGRTGVSVRTLHYYDEIGLLSPSHHSQGGYRLYSKADVERLLRIKSLQQLGFSLQEIKQCLDRPDYAPLAVVELHIACLERSIDEQRRLRERLEVIAHELRKHAEPSVVEFMETIDVMSKMEQYYTPEQLEGLRRRREALGEEGMHKAQEDWSTLLSELNTAMAAGMDPASDEAQALAKRYRALIDGFAGGDKGTEDSLRRMYRAEPNIASQHGYTPDPQMGAFVSAALAACEDD